MTQHAGTSQLPADTAHAGESCNRPKGRPLSPEPVLVALLVAVAVGLGAAAAHTLADAQATTVLDRSGTVTVDGHRAVPREIVASHIRVRYRPLRIGRVITAVSCPTGLPAVAGTSLTCSGKVGGRPLSIPVTVIKASGHSVTWAFRR